MDQERHAQLLRSFGRHQLEHVPILAGDMELFEAYREALRSRGLVDYNDLIALAGELLRRHPDQAAAIRGRWDAVLVDDTYVRESILNPTAKIVQGFAPIMPTFQGQVSEEQLLALIEYIKSLPPGQSAPGAHGAPGAGGRIQRSSSRTRRTPGSPRGGQWHPSAVAKLLERAKPASSSSARATARSWFEE